MSKLFYDHIIRFETLEIKINQCCESHEEKNELWGIVDKIVHNRIIYSILDRLPHDHHHEFVDMIHDKPFDKTIMKYLNEITGEDMEILLKEEFKHLEQELLREMFDE